MHLIDAHTTTSCRSMRMVTVAAIPSPSRGVYYLGAVPLHAYGFVMAVAILVAARIGRREWVRRGHDANEFSDLVAWIVVAGILGARIYHVVSDYQLFVDRPLRVVQIWNGGLSIWGAVAGGAVAVAVLARRRHLDVLDLVDSIAPGLVLGQAIGRWGNWFNQELFGEPTSLPWGLLIDPAHRPRGYEQFATFHPTFLYESLWAILVFVVLIWMDRRLKLAKGQVCAAYIALYTAGRFVLENMRIDPAHTIGPMRLNAWVSLGLFLFGVAWFVWLGRRNPYDRTVLRPGTTAGRSSPST